MSHVSAFLAVGRRFTLDVKVFNINTESSAQASHFEIDVDTLREFHDRWTDIYPLVLSSVKQYARPIDYRLVTHLDMSSPLVLTAEEAYWALADFVGYVNNN